MATASDLAGIDGCPGGWVAARMTDGDIDWATAPVGGLAAIVGAVTAIDIPIGLEEEGWRASDLAARNVMGAARSRVFLTPPRAVLEQASAPNATAQATSRRLTGQGVSRQALALAPRILEADALVASMPGVAVHESFPEITFMRMSELSEPLATKKSARGAGQRLAALLGWRVDIADALARAPEGVPVDDCLDALACLWAAERIASGIHEPWCWIGP